MKTYTTKGGKTQYMPSLEEVNEMDADNEGFCLACGNWQEGCEPDAVRYVCDTCQAPKVYGAMELAQMGLVY